MGKMLVKCDPHGRVPWNDDIICVGCSAVWQCRSEAEPRYAPEMCTCGRRLLPPPGERGRRGKGGKGGEFSARLLCPKCAEAARKAAAS